MKIIVIVSLCVFGLLALARYIYRMKLIRDQDQEIKKLNLRIQEKDDFIVELIRKYGNPKEGKEFLNKLKTKLNSNK